MSENTGSIRGATSVRNGFSALLPLPPLAATVSTKASSAGGGEHVGSAIDYMPSAQRRQKRRRVLRYTLRMRRYLRFLLVVCALSATGRAARAFDVVVAADQDTFINSAAADNNNGASPSLYTGHNGMDGGMRALVRFAIPAAWQGRVTVTRAVLAMVTRGTGNQETTVPTTATESLQALTAAWTEGIGFGDATR